VTAMSKVLRVKKKGGSGGEIHYVEMAFEDAGTGKLRTLRLPIRLTGPAAQQIAEQSGDLDMNLLAALKWRKRRR